MYASVIVPTYNKIFILEATVKALLNQTVESSAYEIIVIDDGSVDTTAEFMSHLAVSESIVTYIRHEENKGRVITRNDGICAARGDIIIFLDDDNLPARDFIEEHMKYYKMNQGDKIAVMGNVSYAPEVIGNSNFAKYLQSRYLGNRPAKERQRINYSDLPARFLGTLNCSMRRLDLLEAGMLDDKFRYYGGEDGYLGQCLKDKGVRLIFGSNAHSLHYDKLTLPRYKQKMYELSKFGLKVLKIYSPKYLESTKFKYLIPISIDNDSGVRVISKCIIKCVLNRVSVFCIEKWIKATDSVRFLYFSPLYRMLLAGWIIQGQKLDKDVVEGNYDCDVK